MKRSLSRKTDNTKASNGLQDKYKASEINKVARARVRALERMLGQPISVLDNGFVRVIDYMGDEAAIVQAARVSYGKGTRKVQSDNDLIRFLLRNRHTTPFEMCELKLHVRVPMDCWRQWIRHRTASVNEYSTRYSVAIDSTQRTSPSEWRIQASLNKQGSEGYLASDVGSGLSKNEAQLHDRSRNVYLERIALGVAREQARKDLPLSTYTEAYWKIDLHNLLHFLDLRMSRHAQLEIRSYANVIGGQIVAKWVPTVWQAFIDYRLNSISLSEREQSVLHAFMREGPEKALRKAFSNQLLKRSEDGKLLPSRERSEFEGKLRALGFATDWLLIIR